MLVHLHTTCGCFHATRQSWVAAWRLHVQSTKPKTFALWHCTDKADPCSSPGRSHRCDQAQGYRPELPPSSPFSPHTPLSLPSSHLSSSLSRSFSIPTHFSTSVLNRCVGRTSPPTSTQKSVTGTTIQANAEGRGTIWGASGPAKPAAPGAFQLSPLTTPKLSLPSIPGFPSLVRAEGPLGGGWAGKEEEQGDGISKSCCLPGLHSSQSSRHRKWAPPC